MPFQPKRSLLPFTMSTPRIEMSEKKLPCLALELESSVHSGSIPESPQGTCTTSHTDAKDIGLLSILEINMEFIEAAG